MILLLGRGSSCKNVLKGFLQHFLAIFFKQSNRIVPLPKASYTLDNLNVTLRFGYFFNQKNINHYLESPGESHKLWKT